MTDASAIRHVLKPGLISRRIHASREPDSGRAPGRGTTTFMTLTCLLPGGCAPAVGGDDRCQFLEVPRARRAQ